MLSALREESHSSRFDNIDWITKLFTVSARKSADLVVIQYEDSLTDDLRATIMECWEHKQQVVLLHVYLFVKYWTSPSDRPYVLRSLLRDSEMFHIFSV